MHYGKALAMLGWRELSKVRRHGQGQAIWFVRQEDGPLWIPASEVEEADDPEVDDLLG